MRSHRIAAGTLAALVLAAGASVRAQPEDCEDDGLLGPLEFTPAIGASNVTLDAPIKIRYSDDFFVDGTADPESALTLSNAETGEEVSGRTEVLDGDILFFYPDELLEPTTRYEGIAFGLERDEEINFRTGRDIDRMPPDLGEIVDVSSSKVKDRRCDAPEGGYRVDVVVEPAREDGPIASVEYLLYLTRGPGIVEPEQRDVTRGFATDEITMVFVLSPAEAVEPVCVAVQAVDGVGKVDDDGRPVCFDPVQGNFFEPLCSATGAGAGRGRGLLPIGLMLAALAWRRRGARCPS